MLFCETNNIWMMPSLGIPRFETALLYPGMCLFEGTNLSEGRGTSCPFEIIGAPFINGYHLTQKMNEQALPGVIFTAAYFTPTASKHVGIACQGVHAHITDMHQFRPVRTALVLLDTIYQMYGDEFAFLPPVAEGKRPMISLLVGSGIFEGRMPEMAELLTSFEKEAAAFVKRKQEYHIYQ